MDAEREQRRRSWDPFDNSAVERQRRMGLLNGAGDADHTAVSVFSHIYAGLFFDQLMDAHDDFGEVEALCRRLIELNQTETPRRMMLALCLEYDNLHTPLPGSVWWITGSAKLPPLFITGFIERLEEFLMESEGC